MGKYGVVDVFDLAIYDKDGLVFEIDTVKEIIMERREDCPNNIMVVKDALFDEDLFNEVMAGKFDHRNLRIIGKSRFRSLDGSDKDVELRVTASKLTHYSFPTNVGNVSVVDLEFQFPSKDAYGFMNVELKVRD